MFPSPQSALPLPRHPNLERYRKIAKDLVKGCRSGEPKFVRDWAQEWVQSLVNLSGLVITQLPVRVSNWVDDVEAFALRQFASTQAGKRTCTLTAAQFVIAPFARIRELAEILRASSIPRAGIFAGVQV